MQETALNVPFEAGEIIHIVAEELQARMRGLSPLTGSKEYAAFSVDYHVKIRLRRAGETIVEARETLAWGNVTKGTDGKAVPLTEDHIAIEEKSHFDSKDPNEERVARDLPLTIESGDGRGGRIRKKARVKG